MSHSLTTKQQRVLDTLRQAGAPLTAYALLDQLRDHGLTAPTQVYRALDKLAEQGVVHRLESLNAYVCCSHPDEGSHDFSAFAICDSCGQVDEFVDDALNRSEEHTSELQSPDHLVCRLLLEKKNIDHSINLC